ncbi:peptide deformylase [Acidisphaera rubrifaciens]|uniref:Peptide deformylase n=1 Tax=Acidisphaera rubrifaciens HS-AP3 TaxID=1231350 RepID=A0A0D6P748_9PROT|nr:peptide deformylase [Acidisphaera rubrifaciens]GAN76679.1 peptide deformylase [Acidisphaera rubrifaciens HS-AP3]
MAILKIARVGHPVLLTRALDVPYPFTPEVTRLVGDMIETMHDAGGVGLAAPQVHVALRLFVFRVPAGRGGDDPDDRPTEGAVLINPVVEPVGDDVVEGWEGCLSIPDMRAKVPRARRIRYRGMDISGASVDMTVSGFHARVVQHEYDHLEGILYPMRVTDFRFFGYADELARAGLLSA